MKAVRYDRFGGIDQLYLAELPEPDANGGEVVIRVEAGALNPGALPALTGSSFTPIRDLAGEVVAVGEGVRDVAVGDAVLGWLQSWDAHAQRVALPAGQLVQKPDGLAWDVAGSLYTTPMAGLGAVKAVEPRAGEVVVISGASGGVGFTAAQLAVRAGATVIGLTSAGHVGLLEQHGVTPVQYGDGEEARIRAAAGGRRIAAFIDAGGLPALAELARLAASGALSIPIAATYPLTAVQDAYRALADRRAHGRIVLHPQDVE